MNFIKQHRSELFLFFTFAIYFLSFAFNSFNIAPIGTDKAFKYDDGFVLGRLIANEQESFFSYGMLTGFYIDYPLYDSDSLRTGGRDNPTTSKVFSDFIDGNIAGKGNFNVYRTLPGGQAMLVSLGQAVIPLDNGKLITLFRLITICLCSLSFVLFLKWVQDVFGLLCAATTFVFLFLSPWFLLFTQNLWWALWSYYIPFSILLFLLKNRYEGKIYLSDKKLLLSVCGLVFFKYFFSGTEFITTYLIMIMCPIIFYLYLDTTKDVKQRFVLFIKACLAAIVGVLAGFVLLSIQLYALTGDWRAGIDHIILSFFRRSFVDQEEFSVLQVLSDYIFKGNPFYWEWYGMEGGFIIFIVAMLISSVLILFLNKHLQQRQKRIHKALIIVTAISLLAPLSWILIFAQHAYIHVFIDYITWYMPFVLLVFVQLGVVLELVLKKRTS